MLHSSRSTSEIFDAEVKTFLKPGELACRRESSTFKVRGWSLVTAVRMEDTEDGFWDCLQIEREITLPSFVQLFVLVLLTFVKFCF